MIRHKFLAFALGGTVLLAMAGCAALELGGRGRDTASLTSPELQSPPPPQRGLEVIFFGTSTLLLSDGDHSILIDGFFSRPSQAKMLSLAPDENRINAALTQAGILKSPDDSGRKVDAIFVSHAHHDHALDCGVVAQKTGAIVFGCESTLHIARGQGTREEQLRLLENRQPVGHRVHSKELGDFTVTAYATPHPPWPVGPFLMGPPGGKIKRPLKMPATALAFRMEINFSFLIEHPKGRVLVVPSAACRTGDLQGVSADVILLGIGTLGKHDEQYARDYWAETVGRSGAKLVIPIHWDDFTRPLDEGKLHPMSALTDNLASSMSWLWPLAQASGAKIFFLPPQKPTFLPRGTPGHRQR